MRRFSFRPALTIKGRKSFGIRGFSGKPFHPPLTDVPVGAYTIAAAADVLSWLGGDASWAHSLYRAGTVSLIGGALVSLFAALTGYFDWSRSTQKGTQVRRTVNAHAWTMIATTIVVLIDIAVRLTNSDAHSTPIACVVLSVLAFVLVAIGGTLGGSLVYDYGFNVRTAGDSPAWHPSEEDLMPGQRPKPAESS
jgi:uncharacterized membrane protein